MANYGFVIRVSDSFQKNLCGKSRMTIVEKTSVIQTSRYGSIQVAYINGQAL